MPRPTDDAQIARFLDALARNGGNAGNYAMMRGLELNENEYWRLRNKMLDAGLITLGKGRGGSVILVPDVEAETQASPESPSGETSADAPMNAATSYGDEHSLYQPCLDVLRSQWASMHRLFDFKAEITARQGRKSTGGIWTRPDISAVSIRTFPHWPGRHFDLWTFEIKTQREFNVNGLSEALAHARVATQSWALFHVDQNLNKNNEQESNLERMQSEAQRLGVGLILFSDPAKFETWDIKAYSTRTAPDPALHDDFVKTQLSPETRDVLQQWSR